jgi:hypothetical protein
MVYKISPRTQQIAKDLGVQVFPSDNPKYKLEVYDSNGQFITYTGASGYKDFHIYSKMEKNGELDEGTAKKRQDLYWRRHIREIKQLGGINEWLGSRSYYAFALLWS